MLTPKFVDKLPDQLDCGILYISIRFNTIGHLCPCGCKCEVLTPISQKRGWVMSYNGKNISLNPSIGNWNLNCKSHYWIRNCQIEWCDDTGSNSGKTKNNLKIKHWFNQFFS